VSDAIEAILGIRKEVELATDRALAQLATQQARSANDMRAVRLLLLDLRDAFIKRGDKDKGEDCLRVAQYITAELR
jgi:hypothetical protein